jgi:hypothetical protein
MEYVEYMTIGIFLLIISLVCAFIGIRKYWLVKKLIRNIDPFDWQIVEKTIRSEKK